jgi:transposase
VNTAGADAASLRPGTALTLLGAIRALNRLACMGEAMRHTLNRLEVVVPEWRQTHSCAEWLGCYRWRAEDDRLSKSELQRQAYARAGGMDGYVLLDALDAHDQLAV